MSRRCREGRRKLESWTRVLQEEMRAVDPDVHVTLTKLDEKVEKYLLKKHKSNLFHHYS